MRIYFVTFLNVCLKDLSEKKKPLNNVKFWPVVSAVDVVDLERLRPQDFIAQQQYEAVLSQKRNPVNILIR